MNTIRMKPVQADMVRRMTEPTSRLYRDRRGNVLIATPYDRGLWRSMIRRDGVWEPLFSGPVDRKKWTELNNEHQPPTN